MISLIIIAILTMALIGTISMNMLDLGNQTEQVVRSLEERTDILTIKNAIKQELRPVGVNRILALPTGDLSSSGYTTLPDSISIDNTNAWGMEYIYCPYSSVPLAGAGNGTVQTAASDSYDIQTTPFEGKDYIIASAQSAIAQYNILAAIISPIPSATTPQCEDVRYDDVNDIFYVINYDGVVEVIKEETSIISREPVSLTLSSSNTGLSIDQEVSSWPIELPELYTINLDGGSYVTSNINFISPIIAKTKQVSIIGDINGTTQITGGGLANIVFENTVVFLQNITFSGDVNVIFNNSDVYLDNVSLSSLSVNNSNIKSRGNVQWSANVPVVIENSTVDFRNNTFTVNKNNASNALRLNNATLLAENITVENNSSGGVGLLVDELSSLSVSGSIIFNGAYLLSGTSVNSNAEFALSNAIVNANIPMETIFYVQGGANINNSFINGNPSVNNAIVMGDGAELDFSNSAIGGGSASPVMGIQDLGGTKFISGQSSSIDAISDCWVGDIFYLAPSSNGATSATSDNNYKMVNKSNWSCTN